MYSSMRCFRSLILSLSIAPYFIRSIICSTSEPTLPRKFKGRENLTKYGLFKSKSSHISEKNTLGFISRSKLDAADDSVNNDSPTSYADAFMLRDSRVGFIRKVYLCLTCQLAFTALAVIFSSKNKRTIFSWLLAGEGQKRFTGVMYGGLAVTISSLLALESKIFGNSLTPTLSLLALFTIGECFIVSLFCLFFESKSVFLALIQTAAATFGLSIYAFQTNPKYDLTGVGSALGSGLIIFFSFGILKLLFPNTFEGFEVLYSSIGACLFSLFIVYDTQRVIGGKHRNSDMIDRKDWALGSIALYTDIIALFMHLLRIFGREGE